MYVLLLVLTLLMLVLTGFVPQSLTQQLVLLLTGLESHLVSDLHDVSLLLLLLLTVLLVEKVLHKDDLGTLGELVLGTRHGLPRLRWRW